MAEIQNHETGDLRSQMAVSKALFIMIDRQAEFAPPVTYIEPRNDVTKAEVMHNTSLYIVSRTGSYIWHKATSMICDWGRVVFHDFSDTEHMLSFPKTSNVILVDIDIFQSLDDAIDWLLKFRVRNPTTPVVISSDRFTYNDLSIQRMAIADVSVRTPSSKDFLSGAVLQAIENNKLYQKSSFGQSA